MVWLHKIVQTLNTNCEVIYAHNGFKTLFSVKTLVANYIE